MHVLIAPNAFKNSVTALEAAFFIEQGLHASQLGCSTECFPVADGGDGTGGLIIEKCNGIRIETEAHDPLGRSIISSFGLIDDGKTAVIEMADASGLRLLKTQELNPLRASSYGTGELVKAALDLGVDKIIIAMGGSATVDGGCGILSALGFLFLDNKGTELEAIPEKLINISLIDSSKVDPRVMGTEVVVLCDVDNVLLGPNGSAAVFGPQKGADLVTVEKLENFLINLKDVAWKQNGRNMEMLTYGGAAGGAAAGLHVFLNARLVNGIDYFLNLTLFDDELLKADVVITGEGSIDSQTLQGKGPFGVASRARNEGKPVIGIAGKVPLDPEPKLLEYFNALIAIGNGPSNLPDAMADTPQNLVRVSRTIGDLLSLHDFELHKMPIQSGGQPKN